MIFIGTGLDSTTLSLSRPLPILFPAHFCCRNFAIVDCMSITVHTVCVLTLTLCVINPCNNFRKIQALFNHFYKSKTVQPHSATMQASQSVAILGRPNIL